MKREEEAASSLLTSSALAAGWRGCIVGSFLLSVADIFSHFLVFFPLPLLSLCIAHPV